MPTARGGDGVAKGVVRPALTPEDMEAREWLLSRARDAGMSTYIDGVGNTLACGPDASSGPRLLCGSHSDSQPTGGWLDGALGCVYALEAARAMAESGGPQVIDVINFQDEEGRFGSLVGSTLLCGSEPHWDAMSSSPEAAAPKETLAQAARARGLEGKSIFRLGSAPFERNYIGFLEAHIEQGRRLEKSGTAVAAVSSIVGLRQCQLMFTGEANHAGTTMMADRRDAAAAAFAFAAKLNSELAERFGQTGAVWTIGQCRVVPGAPSIVPGRAELTFQWRAPTNECVCATRALFYFLHPKNI